MHPCPKNLLSKEFRSLTSLPAIALCLHTVQELKPQCCGPQYAGTVFGARMLRELEIFDKSRNWLGHESFYPTPAICYTSAEFPDPAFLVPLHIKLNAARGPLEYLLDYGGVRYLLVLNYNSTVVDCLENVCLQRVYNAFSDFKLTSLDPFQVFYNPKKGYEALFQGTRMCIELFWPFVREHMTARLAKGGDLLVPDCTSIVKIQLETANGKLWSEECLLEYEEVPSPRERWLEFVNPPMAACESFPSHLASNLPTPLVVRLMGARGFFAFLLEYCGIRYSLFLEYNNSDRSCAENRSLEVIYEGYKRQDNNLMFQGSSACLQLFWPFIMEHADRHERHECSVSISGKKKTIQIQLRTIEGTLLEEEHDWVLPYQDGPIDNPFSDLQIFAKNEIEEISKIYKDRVLHVRIRENEYTVKPIHRTRDGNFLREIEALRKVQSHPNVIRLIGLVDVGEGKVDGIVLSYITGITLQSMPWIRESQGKRWKAQIKDAVEFLHRNNVIWGDAKPANILIDKRSNDAILIDFGGGRTYPWVDPELRNTREGDLQGLGRILDFIDEKVAGKNLRHLIYS